MKNLKNIIDKQQCPLRATLQSQSVIKQSNKSGSIRFKFRDIFLKEINKLEDLKKVDKEYLEELFPMNIFDSLKEREQEIKKALRKIDTLLLKTNALLDYDLKTKVEDIITIGTEDFSLKVDMVLTQGDNVVLMNLKDTTAVLKKKGQKETTREEYSIELYGMYLLGTKLYPNKNIKATIAYLKEEADSKNYFASRVNLNNQDYFEGKIKSIIDIDDTSQCCDNSCEKCTYKSLCEYVHALEPVHVMEPKIVDKSKKKQPIPFTGEQKQIINFMKGIGVVNAVAGAGKTLTMAKRVQILLDLYGVDETEILVLSFSEKSIQEFKEKMKDKFDMDDFENAYTFNGYGDKLMRDNYGIFGYSRVPRLIDDIENYDLIKDVIDTSPEIKELETVQAIWKDHTGIISKLQDENMFMKMGKNEGMLFQLEKVFNKIKSKGLQYTGKEFVEEELDNFKDAINKQTRVYNKETAIKAYKAFLIKIYQMYSKYNYLLKDRGYYSYADQINYLVNSFSNPRILNNLRYRHIICDEFQDSNDSAMYILKKLTSSPSFESLLVVGDINQSIYGFQGTTPENLTAFADRFNRVKNFDLSYSFRVPQVVAKVSNGLMNDSFEVKYNKMKAFRKDAGNLRYITGEKKQDIESNLISEISNFIKQGKNVGIITRNNKDINAFANLLIKNDIPYLVKSNLDVMSKPKVSNLNDLPKSLLNLERESLGYIKYLQIADNAEFNKHFKKDTFKTYINSKVNALLDEIDTLSPVQLMKVYYDLMEPLAEQDFMIDAYLKNIKSKRFRSLLEIRDYCKKLDIYKAKISAPENESEASVILTTAHSSKGREFDKVIMDTSTFSAYNEEDRRLFYVAMTRAKEDLNFVSYSRIGGSRRTNCNQYLQIINNCL